MRCALCFVLCTLCFVCRMQRNLVINTFQSQSPKFAFRKSEGVRFGFVTLQPSSPLGLAVIWWQFFLWARFGYFVEHFFGTFTKSKPTSFIPLPPSDWQCYNGSLSRTFCWAAAEFASEAAHNHLSSAGYIYQPRYISPYPLHHHQLWCILCIPTLQHPLPCPAAPWRPGDPHVMMLAHVMVLSSLMVWAHV